jgi:hypothetical protein
MKFARLVLCASALAMPMSANALVSGLGGGGPILTLTSAGLDGGAAATLSGGTVYSSDQAFASLPLGTVGNFLAAGPSSGAIALLTFAPGTDYLSFLWGSPDVRNRLTLTTTGGAFVFSPVGMGFSETAGNQSFAQQVYFIAGPGEFILTARFANAQAIDAMEVSNFSITPVPEPASWALMIGGFAIAGAAMRRRRTSIAFA